MTDDQPRKKRRPNFSAEETMALVSAVSENQLVLLGKLHLDVERNAVNQRDNAWQKVTDRVNSISDVERDADEVRTKYKHFKSELKKKWAKDQRHKGSNKQVSNLVTYSAAEKALLQLLAQESSTESPEVPYINNVMLTVDDVLETLTSGEQLDTSSSSVSMEGLATLNIDPINPVVSTATSATLSPPLIHLPWVGNESPALTANQHHALPPSHQGTVEEILGVQREIRDLLKELNNTVAAGFRDVVSAMRYVADKGSHT